jgi:hypothetical protein
MKVAFEEGRQQITARDRATLGIGIQRKKDRYGFTCWMNGEDLGAQLSRSAIAAIREKWKAV